MTISGPDMKTHGIKKIPANRGGSVLGVMMLFLAVFAILGFAAYRIISAQTGNSLYQAQRTKAFYIAEAGAEDVMQVLVDTAAPSAWTVGFSSKAFGGGYYTVALSTLTSPARLTVTGRLPGRTAFGKGATAAVRVYLSNAPGLFAYVLGSLGNPGNKGVTVVSTVVNGDIYQSITTANPLPLPVMNTAAMRTDASNPGGCPNGNVSLSGITANLGPRCIHNGGLTITNSTITLTGTVYMDRDLQITGSYVTGAATIYVGGNITISGNSQVGTDVANTSPFIYSDVTGNSARVLIQDSTVLRTGLFSPNAHMDIINSVVSGSFIAGNSEYTNAGKPGIATSTMTWEPIYYPGGYGSGALSVVPGSWDEVY